MNSQEATRNRKRVPILYLDLDGTVRKGFDELGRFVNTEDDVELFPHMRERLASYRQQGWRIVAVTNQGGIATGLAKFEDVRDALMKTQVLSGMAFDMMYMCQHHPAALDPVMANCFCRKPKMGMLVLAQKELSEKYPDEMYPPHLAMMVGDRDEDRICAERAGVKFQIASEWRLQPFTLEIGVSV